MKFARFITLTQVSQMNLLNFDLKCFSFLRLKRYNKYEFWSKVEKISSVYMYSEYCSSKAYNFYKFHWLRLK